MKAYDVFLNRKNIDTVFYNATGKNKKERQEDVKQSLINHDGYNYNINVREVTKWINLKNIMNKGKTRFI